MSMGSTGQEVHSSTTQGELYGPVVCLTADLFHRLERLDEIVKKRVRIVLHGTNSFDEKTTRACIARGVSKINVNKLVLETYSDNLQVNASKVTLTKLMEEGVELTMRAMEEQMNICGSTGKA